MYVITGFGVTVGFHRLLTHRSFQTFKPVEYSSPSFGSMAVQGPVMTWVADHRKHHAHTTRRATRTRRTATAAASRARSPASGTRTWAGCSTASARPRPSAMPRTSTRTAACGDPQDFWLWCSRFCCPFVLGWAIGGTLARADRRRCGAAPVRIFLLHHVTWSINSVCHFFGTPPLRRRRPLDQRVLARRCSFGESWHHNHHAFPRSAMHGLQVVGARPDGAGSWAAMKRLRLAWNAVEIATERQHQKLAPETGPGTV